MPDLKTIFGQQLLLIWDHCFLEMKKVEIYCLFIYLFIVLLTVLNAFIETVNESNHKPNRLWADQEKKCTINVSKNC